MHEPSTDRSILIVEDDEDSRELLKHLLELTGYHVAVAAHGQEALEHLRKQAERAWVVLLDLMMPVMNGWEFRAAQLQDPQLKAIPIVVLTADGRASAKARQLSAAGHVAKPVQVTELIAVLEQIGASPA